jgi:2-C-methyl-D-erythritol 4-phosphate cytidylyltransferase
VQTDESPPSAELLTQSGPYPVSVYGLPVSDTCKEVIDGLVHATVPREKLIVARGPWVFTREALVEALGRVAGREAEMADLIGFCEAARLRVRVLPGA